MRCPAVILSLGGVDGRLSVSCMQTEPAEEADYKQQCLLTAHTLCINLGLKTVAGAGSATPHALCSVGHNFADPLHSPDLLIYKYTAGRATAVKVQWQHSGRPAAAHT